MDQKRKLGVIIGGIVLACVLIGGAIFFYMSKQSTPDKTLQAYVEKLNEKDYEGAYELLSISAQGDVSKEDFVKRNTNIYAGIGARDFTIETKERNDDNMVAYTMKLNSHAGEISNEGNIEMIKEDGSYRLSWTSNFIFPQLDTTDSISVDVTSFKRGSILDRDGNVLVEDGSAMEVGLVAGGFGDDIMSLLSTKLNMSEEAINTALRATWVQDGLYVPLITMKVDSTLKDELTSLKGVQIRSVQARVYPYGKKAAHLTGYVQAISSDELLANPDKGYDETSLIGKTGLEAIYEDRLRGSDGITILIKTQDGQVKKTIAERAVKNGSDVTTTISASMQSAMYDAIVKENDSGTATALNPLTGEVLALVSAPAYDPNDFALGMNTRVWTDLNEDPLKPLTNRFVSAFTPGSTFKAITGAIGLDTKTVSADQDLGKVDGWKWQADASWGDYYVTTTTEYSQPSNLENAMKFSDNTYFARLATSIGAKPLAENLNTLGFHKQMDFDFTLAISTFGENETIEEGAPLADTGFGQGKLQMNPLHLTALYSAFVNDGSIMNPYLNVNDEKKNTVWLDQVITKESADTIFSTLTASMDAYGGTSTGLAIGGKTGTAEVGNEQLGWLSAVCKEGEQPISISIMIENTKEKGGSGYLIPMMRNLLNTIL